MESAAIAVLKNKIEKLEERISKNEADIKWLSGLIIRQTEINKKMIEIIKDES